MKRSIWVLTLATYVLLGSGSAQDPFKVSPQSYKLEYENEWVMAPRVHYPPCLLR